MLSTDKKIQVARYIGLDGIKRVGENYTIILGHTHYTKKEITLDQEGLDLLLYFLEPRTILEASKQFSIEKDSLIPLCQNLVNEKILIDPQEFNKKFERYDRHLLYYKMVGEKPDRVQESISNSKIGLIGMGGIGNWVSMGLIGAGFKEIVLMDFDTIELSNLTRQVLFDEDDIGKFKVEVAKEKLSKKNSDTEINTKKIKVNSSIDVEKMIEGLDFLILSADTPPRYSQLVGSCCKKNESSLSKCRI
ncbi:ThiF family adenylyltransferase [Bacteriovoracales bacterium]|nr:ThiF family adenylyltransferase [Bacteriovoracales bacterium]